MKKKLSYKKGLIIIKNDVNVICYNTLTNFPSRQKAIRFYFECMQCSEGAERDRYVNIYMDLVSTRKKLVHDQDDYFFPEPTFYKVKKFVDNHAEIIDELPKAMTYKEYITYKENNYDKTKKNMEKDNMELD